MNRLEKLRADVTRAWEAGTDAGYREAHREEMVVIDEFMAEYESVEVTHYRAGCRDYLALPGDARFDECAFPAPYDILVPRAMSPEPIEWQLGVAWLNSVAKSLNHPCWEQCNEQEKAHTLHVARILLSKEA